MSTDSKLAEVMALVEAYGCEHARAGRYLDSDMSGARTEVESAVAGILSELEAAQADAARCRWLFDRCIVHLLNDEVELRACIRAKTVAGIGAAIDSAIHKGKA